jgi:hypothetical protein
MLVGTIRNTPEAVTLPIEAALTTGANAHVEIDAVAHTAPYKRAKASDAEASHLSYSDDEE